MASSNGRYPEVARPRRRPSSARQTAPWATTSPAMGEECPRRSAAACSLNAARGGAGRDCRQPVPDRGRRRRTAQPLGRPGTSKPEVTLPPAGRICS